MCAVFFPSAASYSRFLFDEGAMFIRVGANDCEQISWHRLDREVRIATKHLAVAQCMRWYSLPLD